MSRHDSGPFSRSAHPCSSDGLSRLWPSFIDQIEWRLCGTPEAAKTGRIDDFLYSLLACLSSQTQPNFLRSGTGCAEQSRE